MSATRICQALHGRSVLSVVLLVMSTFSQSWAYSNVGSVDGIVYSAEKQNNERSILWKVERSGLRPSYVFATINSEDPRITQLPPPVIQAFQLSDTFAMEMIPDHRALMRMSAAMFIDTGPDLEKLMGKKYFEKLSVLVEKYGIASHVLKKLKPWVVFTALTMPKPEDGIFLDVILYGAALNDGKNVHGLETADEQVSTFEDIGIADQLAILKDVIDHYSMLSKLHKEIVKRYTQGDLDAVAALQDEYLATEDKRLIHTFRQHVIDDRNQRIVNRILARIEEQNAFIAIDAGLLPGDGGVLHLLQKRGYHISPVY